ncbi:hypothetical protein PHLGIDRAFT_107588 [Phlebiopsis gigantea 11061_1 CR5-6]|uniref:Proline iminopeptidase n=1 Tax=Phlebiopsis gigantea (strain 11061_1 CR5-6) TaxID=745531 RepID=A0A0C3S612_PHLG1|nr:hypothetical protein PHLGIDRAFT_107588 [Phlebiopsis gigantea 11061_1 CR5-6]
MYPPIEPFQIGFLQVSDIHNLYYELAGNPQGTPVLFLHGGPGGGCYPIDRSWFNPVKYKIILFDQRGCGKSTPFASIKENTTWDLVNDCEKLREHVEVEKWHVFGGSWGSTLALAYAQSHPYRVKSLVLRGIFTLRTSEVKFFFQEGTSMLFPEAWDDFIAPIPEAERGDMLLAYHARLNSADEETCMKAAKVWTRWEMWTSKLRVNPSDVTLADNVNFALPLARLENHYFVNKGWMRDGQVLEKQSIDKIRNIPCVIIQGRYDVACPATTAYALKKAWPASTLHIVPDAGHSSRETGIAKLLVSATDRFSDF